MRLNSVLKALIIGSVVFLLTIFVSLITDIFIINFFMGYLFGSFGVFYWVRWVSA